MSTAFEEAWAETNERLEQETPSIAAGKSQDQLISDFCRVVKQSKDASEQRKELGAALAGIAYENKGSSNTVRLESTSGQKVKVEFGVEYEFDNEQMFTAADLLGKDLFDSLFTTEVKFVPKKRALNGFLNTVPSDERTKTGKQIIQDAMHKKDKTPYVSIS